MKKKLGKPQGRLHSAENVLKDRDSRNEKGKQH